MSDDDIKKLPHFLTAETASGLKRKMLDNNLRSKKYYRYFDIQYIESEETWYAWYWEFENEFRRKIENVDSRK